MLESCDNRTGDVGRPADPVGGAPTRTNSVAGGNRMIVR